MTSDRRPPLAFVDEYGQANLDVARPDVGTHFVLTAILVDEHAAPAVRTAVEAVRVKHFQTGELRLRVPRDRDREDRPIVIARIGAS